MLQSEMINIFTQNAYSFLPSVDVLETRLALTLLCLTKTFSFFHILWLIDKHVDINIFNNKSMFIIGISYLSHTHY